MLIGVHATSIVITLTKSLETAVVISAYGPLMNDPHKAVKTKNIIYYIRRVNIIMSGCMGTRLDQVHSTMALYLPAESASEV